MLNNEQKQTQHKLVMMINPNPVIIGNFTSHKYENSPLVNLNGIDSYSGMPMWNLRTDYMFRLFEEIAGRHLSEEELNKVQFEFSAHHPFRGNFYTLVARLPLSTTLQVYVVFAYDFKLDRFWIGGQGYVEAFIAYSYTNAIRAAVALATQFDSGWEPRNQWSCIDRLTGRCEAYESEVLHEYKDWDGKHKTWSWSSFILGDLR